MPYASAEKRREYKLLWNHKHPDKVRAQRGKPPSPEKAKEYRRRYYLKHQEAMRIRGREYYWANRERRIASRRENYQRIREALLVHYGGSPPRCACCHESEKLFLTLDHINGGGNKQVRELGGPITFYRWLIAQGFPEGYQILCFNCNNGRRFNGGICPHQLVPLKAEVVLQTWQA